MLTITAENVESVGSFHEYRKTATTRLAFITEPFIVSTKEGDLKISAATIGWDGGYFVALPADGDPYPVSPAYVVASYVRT